MRVVFDKDKTKIIKGVAILFMIILHCLGSPEWYDVQFDEFRNPQFQQIFSSFKICVAIFTFMVGYGYAFSATKDVKYSWNHICRLLLPLWVVLFVFTIPFCKDIDGGVLLKNLFGINSELNYFSWFVYFFIYAMAVMPFVSRLIDKRWWMAIVVVGVAYLCQVAIHSLPNWSDNDFISAGFNCMMQTPCMILGYLFAKYHIFERARLPKSKIAIFVISLLILVGAFVLRYYKSAVLGFGLGVIYAPMAIFSIVVLFNGFRLKYLSTILMKLGELSVYMWFVHALFFTQCVRHIYQPLILVSNNVYVVTLWTMFLTTIIAWVLHSAVSRFQRLVNY